MMKITPILGSAALMMIAGCSHPAPAPAPMQLRAALPPAADADPRAHLVEARHRIDVILNPNK